jgi:hypothetical protein
MSTYNYSDYQSLINDIQDEIEDSQIDLVSPEAIQGYILQGCQRITSLYPVRQKTDLRLLVDQTEYFFSDSTVPVTGTGTVDVSNKDVTGITIAGDGTISTSGKDVTGSGSTFLTYLQVGRMIIVGTQKKMVASITSNTICTIDGQFDSDLSASAYSICSTKFTKEVNPGSTIVVGGVSRIVDEITDAYNLTVTVAYATPQSTQAFTVDTVVTEIPTKFYNIKEITRLEGIVPLPVAVVSNELLQEQKQATFGLTAYSNYSQPLCVSVWDNIAGRKYLEIFPAVGTDKTITIFGFIQVNPRAYVSVALTANIPLSQEYEPAIKEWAKYRLYKKLKDTKSAMEALATFGEYISTLKNNTPSKTRVTVDTN